MQNVWTSSDKVAYAADLVAEATGVHVETLLYSRRRLGHIMEARKMLIMACRKFYGMQYAEIADYIPFTPNVLMRHYHSGVARLRSDSDFEDVWEGIAGRLLRKIRAKRLAQNDQ
jgi:hypothetical protein